jgi:hypothetical protein
MFIVYYREPEDIIEPEASEPADDSPLTADDFNGYDSDSTVVESPLPETSGSSSRPSSSELTESAKKKPRRDSFVPNDSLGVSTFKEALLCFAESRAQLKSEKKKDPEKIILPHHVQAYGQGLLERLSVFKRKRFYEVCKKVDELVYSEMLYGDCEQTLDDLLN